MLPCSLLLYAIGIVSGKVSLDATSSSATVSWSRGNDASLRLQRLDKERSLPITEDGRNGNHTFSQLIPGAAYLLDVTPHDGERESVKFNTKPNKLPLIRSSKFYRESSDTTEGQANDPIYGAVLYWTPPHGSLDGYVLDIQPKHGEIKAPVLQKNGELVQDKTQPRRVITGLEPGEEYNFTISSTSGREVSVPTTLSTRIPPETPGDIKVSEIGSRSAILDWQKEHRGYLDGFYLETNPPDGAISRPKSDTDKKREITGLKAGKRYSVKVHSTAYGLLSFRPSERSIITLPEAPLGDLVVISQEPVNVTLAWTPPDGEAQMYSIIYYPTNADKRKLKELSINSTITLTNLDPGTEYNFEIETVSNGLHSDPMVGSLTTEPDRVTDLEVLNNDFTSASIGWNHPNHEDALYVVEYSPSSQDSWPESPFLTKDSIAAVDGLVPGKTYTFAVKALVGNVESKPERVKTTLPVPEKPSNVSIGDVGNDAFDISWESPYEEALYVVNVFGPDGQLDTFPQTTSDKEVTINGLEEGETYQVTVATVVDGYTTDKHAMKVETFADSHETLLFGMGNDMDLAAAQANLNSFATHLGNMQPDNVIDIEVGEVENIMDEAFAVLSVSISAKPSQMSGQNLNELYNSWQPQPVIDEDEQPKSVFSAPIDTTLDECKLRTNVCSQNAICIDQPILYRCECMANYVDVTKTVVDGSDLVNLPGQVCVANPEDHCVRTNWRFQRNGYLVVRRRMPAVESFTLCFALQLNSQRLRGTLTTYRQGDSTLSLRTDDRGNLEVIVNNEQLFAPNDVFSPEKDQKLCLTASKDLINLYVDGVSVDTLNPHGSVALEGGGKIQIGKDSECNKRCERDRGALLATIEDYTIWHTALTPEEVRNFTSDQCITNGIMTLEQDLVDVNGQSKPTQESLDELYPYDMVADDLIRKFTTRSPQFFKSDPTSDPSGARFPEDQWGFPQYNPTQRSPGRDDSFEYVNLANHATTVDKLIGNIDDLETFCKPDNMTVLVLKAFIDEYESRYGMLTLEDPNCQRLVRGKYYAWEIAPDLLGCGSTIELTDTHVTFVNSLSTGSGPDADQIEAVNGIIFGNQLTESQTTKVSMAVSCKFPLDYTVTADYPFLPQITMQLLKFNVSGHGEFSAVMQLFEDESFTRPFEATPEIDEGEMLNVGVSLLQTEDPSIRVTIMECWATPHQDPNGALQHYLIEEGCGVADVLDGSLNIYENGQSKMAKWAGSVFKFVGYEQVWLHCNIRVCFGDDDCLITCDADGTRRRRDVDDYELHTVSTSHPIRKLAVAIEVDEISIATSDTQGESIITGLIAGVTALTLLLLNAIGLIILRRRRTKSVNVAN